MKIIVKVKFGKKNEQQILTSKNHQIEKKLSSTKHFVYNVINKNNDMPLTCCYNSNNTTASFSCLVDKIHKLINDHSQKRFFIKSIDNSTLVKKSVKPVLCYCYLD